MKAKLSISDAQIEISVYFRDWEENGFVAQWTDKKKKFNWADKRADDIGDEYLISIYNFTSNLLVVERKVYWQLIVNPLYWLLDPFWLDLVSVFMNFVKYFTKKIKLRKF